MKEYATQIGLRIRAARQDSNETQEQLALAVGVVQQSVAAWESGRNLPNILTLIKIATHLKVSSDYLLGMINSDET